MKKEPTTYTWLCRKSFFKIPWLLFNFLTDMKRKSYEYRSIKCVVPPSKGLSSPSWLLRTNQQLNRIFSTSNIIHCRLYRQKQDRKTCTARKCEKYLIRLNSKGWARAPMDHPLRTPLRKHDHREKRKTRRTRSDVVEVPFSEMFNVDGRRRKPLPTVGITFFERDSLVRLSNDMKTFGAFT